MENIEGDFDAQTETLLIGHGGTDKHIFVRGLHHRYGWHHGR